MHFKHDKSQYWHLMNQILGLRACELNHLVNKSSSRHVILSKTRQNSIISLYDKWKSMRRAFRSPGFNY